tara:strand:- start:69 stop:293 length:225 start_codon:yes stop_codon:yes gene_type:complete
MTDREVYLLINQSTALQVDIADALFHAEMGPGGDYHIQHPDGSETLTDEGQEIFTDCHDQAETILNSGGLWPNG